MRSETPLGASDIFTMAPDICNSDCGCPGFYQYPAAQLSYIKWASNLPQYSLAAQIWDGVHLSDLIDVLARLADDAADLHANQAYILHELAWLKDGCGFEAAALLLHDSAECVNWP